MLYYEQTYDTQNNRGYRLTGDPLNQDLGFASDPYHRKAQERLLLTQIEMILLIIKITMRDLILMMNA